MKNCPNCNHRIKSAKITDPQNSNLLDVISAVRNQMGKNVGNWAIEVRPKDVRMTLSNGSHNMNLLVFTIKFIGPNWDLISIKSAIEPKDLY